MLEGIVILDFPGEGLIKKIIESNFLRKNEEAKEAKEGIRGEERKEWGSFRVIGREEDELRRLEG